MSISKAQLATATPAAATAKKTRRPSARDTAGQSAREALKRSPAPPFDVVESKIHVPSLRSGTVSRTALVNRLRATAEPIAILTAPAGYGKTTVLAQWAVRDSRPFAWISLDERDNDSIVLLRHVALALHGIEPLAPSVLDTLAVPGSSIWTSAVPRLGSALAEFDQPVVLVLDDTHLLRSREAFDAVLTIAQHGPEGSLLVLAAFAGVMAAPIYNVSPQMGADLIIVVFAVVVIGGMGSIMGSIVTGFALGVIEGLTKVFFPEASNTVIFVIMAIVLLIRPAGLFGRTA